MNAKFQIRNLSLPWQQRRFELRMTNDAFALFATLGILALAFALRVYRLGDKNIWWDEGWTIWLARHDLAWIAWRTAQDEHPPLHYWLMHYWQDVFGTDAFTGRFFSVCFGVLTVALVYRLGKAIGSAWPGALAALFLALARFDVWWSQDIKNYTLSAFFAWASVWFAWNVLFAPARIGEHHAPQKRNWLGYVLMGTLALYSHYLAALILLANNLFAGMVLPARWRAGSGRQSAATCRRAYCPSSRVCASARRVGSWTLTLIGWSAAQLGVLALFAPWLYVYWQNGATWTAAPTFDFGLFLRLAATVLTLGVTTQIENYTLVVLGLLGVAALSIGWLVVRHASCGMRHAALAWGTRYALLVVLIPPVLIYLLSLTPAALFAPKIQARYLMILAPGLALLLALGVWFAARYARGMALGLVVFVVGAQAFTLNEYYRQRIWRDEYFSLVQVINQFGTAGDRIVLYTDQEWPTFLYYLKRPLEWVGVPNGARVDERTAQRVATQALQSRAVWMVTIPDALAQDPQRLVEQRIAERLPKQYEQTFGDKRLALYAATTRNVKDVPRENFSPQYAREVVFDERLKLVGVDLPQREALPGDVVRVVTYWEAQDLVTINVSLQTLAGETLARQSLPLSMGARERAQADLQIPPQLRTAELRVVAQARLKALPLGVVRVRPREVEGVDAAPAVRRQERFGDSIHLIGATLSAQRLHPGDELAVTLFWMTSAPASTSYTGFVHLLGVQYNPARDNFLWGQQDHLPLDGQLPTNAWTPQRVIADTYRFTVDANAPPGQYQIEVGLYEAATGMRLPVFDASGKALGDAVSVGSVIIE